MGVGEMIKNTLNCKNANYQVNVTYFDPVKNSYQRLMEYYLEKEEAEERVRYWNTYFEKLYTGKYEYMGNFKRAVWLSDLKKKSVRKTKVENRKPIDDDALQINPYDLEIKNRKCVLRITYIETVDHGTRVISTESEEVPDLYHLGNRLKQIHQDMDHALIKEEGTDKRIIRVETVGEFDWGMTQYSSKDDEID